MITVKTTTVIARPPAEIFAFLTDARTMPLWHRRAIRVDLDSSGPFGVGSTWTAVVRTVPPGSVRRLQCTVTEHIPNRRLMSWTRSLPFVMGTGCELTSANGQTRVGCIREIKLRGLWHLLRPLIQSILEQDMVLEAVDLQRVVASRVPAPPREQM